jgi:predicted Zn-dependent protease
MKPIFKQIFYFTFSVILFQSCSLLDPKSKGKGFNVFTLQQDIELGANVAKEIDGNPTEYPLLDSVKYKDVYAYLYKVRDNILRTGKVDYKDEFKWRLRVIKNDSTLNAFCTPGGYIYIYTGILKFLDSEDQFAGVLGHEIGHADMRHSTRQMTTMYGLQFLLDAVAGNKQAIKQITSSLVGLKFSRSHETEADKRSVLYLCSTEYNADAGAGFFEKIQALGGTRQPEFLSTHPDPGNRITEFRNTKTTMGCQGTKDFKNEYKSMIAKLPK